MGGRWRNRGGEPLRCWPRAVGMSERRWWVGGGGADVSAGLFRLPLLAWAPSCREPATRASAPAVPPTGASGSVRRAPHWATGGGLLAVHPPSSPPLHGSCIRLGGGCPSATPSTPVPHPQAGSGGRVASSSCPSPPLALFFGCCDDAYSPRADAARAALVTPLLGGRSHLARRRIPPPRPAGR